MRLAALVIWAADGRRIGARLVDQLEHVLFLIGRSPARQQLTGFQVLESERSAELGPSHGDLLDLSIPAGLVVNRPRYVGDELRPRKVSY